MRYDVAIGYGKDTDDSQPLQLNPLPPLATSPITLYCFPCALMGLDLCRNLL